MRPIAFAAALLAAAGLALTSAAAGPSTAAPGCSAPNAQTRAEIENLFAAYGPYFDYGQSDAWAALFTDNGTFSFPGADGGRQVITGRTALAAFASQARQPGKVFAHYPGKTLMIREGDKVRAFTPVGVIPVDTTRQYAAQFQALGSYEDVIDLGHDGPRFESRTAGIYGDGMLPEAFTKCRP